jgi:hypothetical protein
MRISVTLPDAASEALSELAISERRDARDQATLLIIRALARRRLVSDDGLERRPGELELAHSR